MMQAILCRETTGFEHLSIDEWPVPKTGACHVRIKVHAAALNHADLLITEGRYQEKPRLPFIPGFEVSGIVDELGAGVTGFEIGQKVLAVVDHGAFAEYVIARADDVIPLDQDFPFDVAAAIPITYGTALGGISWQGRLVSGETLLVHGAAGGTGLAGVEIGAAMGAKVIATARGVEKCAIAAEHGAHETIDSSAEDLIEQIREKAGPNGVDVTFDTVGGACFKASLKNVAWEGRIILVGFASGDIPQIPANHLLVKNASVHGLYWGSYRARDPARVRSGIQQILQWYKNGSLKPHIDQCFSFSSIHVALEKLKSRRSRGKLVIIPDRLLS